MNIEETADKGREGGVDRLGSSGAGGVDLRKELLGLETECEEVEEIENLLLSGSGRSRLVRVAG